MRCLAGYLLGSLILFAGSVQCAEPAAVKSGNIGALIRQLGVDPSSDAATLAKLRVLIAQLQPMSVTADSSDIQEGLWSGEIERVHVDRMDSQGNPVSGETRYFLHTGPEHLQVYFLDERLGNAASGRHMVIRGYRTGRRVLAVEGGRNQRELLRPDKVYRSTRP